MKPTITLNVTNLAWESNGTYCEGEMVLVHECLDWCQEHGIAVRVFNDLQTEVSYDFVTYDRITGVYAEFHSATDAAQFKLRWSEDEI